MRAEQEPWSVVTLRPGPRPLASLIGALRELPGLAISGEDKADAVARGGRVVLGDAISL